jgi:cyclophilin family peptidyl-prolyl cis-trans isomerase
MMFALSKRTFATGNPQVFLQISKAGKPVGNLVFELFADKQPHTAQNFVNLCTAKEGHALAGTHFHHGIPGFGISGGKIGDEDVSSFGMRLPDENLDVRHNRRGLLTTCTPGGTNAVGSQFTITFGETPFLDGYQAVFGECVEGASVLTELESGCDRLGNVHSDITISAAGLKH